MTDEDSVLTQSATVASIPVSAFGWIIAGYRALGLTTELNEDVQATGLVMSQLTGDPSRFIARDQYVGLLRRALQRRNSFAVDAGRQCPFGTFALLDCTISAMPSLRAAIGALTRYFAIISDRGQWQTGPGYIELVPVPGLPDWFRTASLEFGLCYTASRFDELVGRRAVLSIEVPWGAPVWAAAYPDNMVFHAPRAALLLDQESLDIPGRRADPLVAELLGRAAQEALAALPRGSSLQQDVREAIMALVSRGLPGMPEVAARLGTTERTLRRRFSEEGLTFRDVRDEILFALARERLADSRNTMADIAFTLGFTDLRAFHRAFLRWSGSTPGEFRKAMRKPSSRGAAK